MMRTAEMLPENIMGKILKAEGILQLIYSEWLKKDDGYHLKLEEHVMNELETLGKGI